MTTIFDRRWEELVAMDSDEFESMPYEDIHLRAGAWVLPEDHVLVIRVQNRKTKKVKERSYKTIRGAQKALDKIDHDVNDVTFFDDDGMHCNYKTQPPND